METGARVLSKTGLAEVQARQQARKAYDAIRRSTDDVAQIAKATGRSEAEIARIKNHLFRQEHQLTAGLRRFDPDPQIASAWSRLQAGTHSAQDLALLQHEAEELMLMRAGLSQKAAHAAAGNVAGLEGTSAGRSVSSLGGDGTTSLGRALPPSGPSGPKPRIGEPGAAEWRYERYAHRQYLSGKGPGDILAPGEWVERYFKPAASGGRPGRIGGPEQVAAKKTLQEEGILIVENVQVGGRYPDGIRPRPNDLGGTDYFEVGRMLRSGVPEARERVKLLDELRGLMQSDTVTFVDRSNPLRRITYRIEDLVRLFSTLGRRG
jgi:hypothetical protein